jgi:hypothetical protein
MSIAVMLPSRSNPGGAENVLKTMVDTSHDANLILLVDQDQEGMYQGLKHPRLQTLIGDRADITHILNAAVKKTPGYDIYGMMTDDAEFRTKGWDAWTEDAFSAFPGRIGIVSPSHNGGDFVNFPYISREWIDIVGWFACPETIHFCWDTVAEMIGEATQITYAKKDEFRLQHFVDRNDKTLNVFMTDCVQFLGWCVNRRRDIVAKVRAASSAHQMI